MQIEITVPSPGESITQVQVAKWLVSDGDQVEKDQEVVEIDSDKASFPVNTPEPGIIKILVQEGDTLPVGAVLARIEVNQTGSLPSPKPAVKAAPEPVTTSPVTANVPASGAPPTEASQLHATPLARKLVETEKLPSGELRDFFGDRKITRKDVENWIAGKAGKTIDPEHGYQRREERKKLTTLRLKLSERLVQVKNQTAMLTTFNEVNMKPVLDIREKYGKEFREKYDTGLGFMSFFTRAVTIALRDFPQVNSMIDGDELVTPNYADIGIAVSAPKGLVVPVLRDAQRMSMAEIELKIRELAGKARENRIGIDEMKGGTFTITNGGVFGSLMSTPIINPPQAAILGMHKVEERPVAMGGNVVIAPMMYVALSYDHRIIDGRESVGFLVRIKELVEEPVKLLTEGYDPVKLMLEL